MKRRIRIALSVALVAVALLATPVVVLLVAPMAYLGLMQHYVHSATGLNLRLDHMTVSAFPLHVRLEGLALTNPDPAFTRPVLAVREVSATAHLDEFIHGAPTWWAASAAGVVVRLEHDRRGISNWRLGGGAPAGGQSGHHRPFTVTSGRALDFSAVDVSDLTVVRVASQPHRFQVRRLQLERASDERLLIDVHGRYRQRPLDVSGALALPSSDHATDVSLHGDVFGGTVSVQGRVGHNGITPGHARFDLHIDDLSAIGVLLGSDLSYLAPVSLHGELDAPKPGRWRLEAAGGLAGTPAELTLDLTTHAPEYRLKTLDFTFGRTALTVSGQMNLAQHRVEGRLDADDIVVQDLLLEKRPSAQPGPVPMSQRLSTPLAPLLRGWSFDLHLSVARLSYLTEGLKGLELSVHDQAHGAAFSGRVAAFHTARHGGWRLVKPMSADGRLTLPAGRAGGGTGFAAHLSAAGFDGQVSATLPAGTADKPHFAMRGRITDLSAFEGVNLNAAVYDDVLPVEVDLDATLQKTAWVVKVNGFAAAGTHVDGRLSVDPGARPLAIRGTLHAPKIDLNSIPTTSLGVLKGQGKAAAGNKDHEQPPSGGLISNRPLNWSWLRSAHAVLDARADTMIFNQTTFRNAHVRITLDHAGLRLQPLTAKLAKGGIRGHLRLAPDGDGVNADFRLVVDRLVPADLGRPDAGLIDGGSTDLAVKLTAHGRSLQELADTLNGELAVEVQRATIRNALFERLASDVVMETLNMINPFVKKDNETDLDCAAADLVAHDGRIRSRDRILVKTSKLVIRATGMVNLRNEKLLVDFVPSPRQGLGVSLGGLADLVRLGGTLSHPQPEANPAGVVRGGIKLGAAIATGGLSVLAQGLYSRARNAGTTCGSVFEGHIRMPAPLKAADHGPFAPPKDQSN